MTTTDRPLESGNAPLCCPFCKCVQTGPNDKPTTGRYYRCEQCGEIWNPGRLVDRYPRWLRL